MYSRVCRNKTGTRCLSVFSFVGQCYRALLLMYTVDMNRYCFPCYGSITQFIMFYSFFVSLWSAPYESKSHKVCRRSPGGTIFMVLSLRVYSSRARVGLQMRREGQFPEVQENTA